MNRIYVSLPTTNSNLDIEELTEKLNKWDISHISSLEIGEEAYINFSFADESTRNEAIDFHVSKANCVVFLLDESINVPDAEAQEFDSFNWQHYALREAINFGRMVTGFRLNDGIEVPEVFQKFIPEWLVLDKIPFQHVYFQLEDEVSKITAYKKQLPDPEVVARWEEKQRNL